MKEESQGPGVLEKRLIYQHKIEPGITQIKHYGIALAAKTNLPQDIVSLAKELAELIESNTKVLLIYKHIYH